MLVRIVKDWIYPESFFGQTPAGDGVWEDITFTEDAVAECDYLLVLQRPPYTIDVMCPIGNAWLITQEPPTKYFKFFAKSFPYFDRVYSYYRDVKHPAIQSMQPVLPWHLLKSYQYLSSLSQDDVGGKRSEIVWITSSKSGFAGQTARMIFLKHLRTVDFKINLFGRGFTPINDKFDGLFPFKYALAVENYSQDHYWTEKIADCFLSWCLPFYWGAENLDEYFPKESFIRIDIHDPEKALLTIQEAIRNNEWEKRLNFIEDARNLILNKYQFFPYLSAMIKDAHELRTEKSVRRYLIPENPYPQSYRFINQFKYYWNRLFHFRRL